MTMFKTISRAVIGAILGVATLTSCATVLPSQGAPGPAVTPPRIVVADIPGVDDEAVFAPWNQLAGYRLFGNGPNPTVTFVHHTPICGTVGCPDPTDRREAGVIGNVIFYDETLRPGPIGVETWQHELGHIVIKTVSDTGCDHPYRGVMSYCEFWTTRPGWFGPADAQLLRDNGY